MQLTEQEIVRRNNLQKIIDLGFNPFPAELVEINHKSTDFTTQDYHKNLEAELIKLDGIDAGNTSTFLKTILSNRYKSNAILEDEQVKKWGIGESVQPRWCF